MSLSPLLTPTFRTRTKLQFMRGVMSMVRRSRSLAGLPNDFICTRRGIRYSLDLGEAIDGCLYLVHDYEPELTQAFGRLIIPGSTALDIGANIGAHTLTLARLVGDEGRVVAFEPSQFALAKLKKNLELNPELARRVTLEARFLNDGSSPVPESISSSWNIARDIDDPERNRLDGGFASALVPGAGISLDQWCATTRLARLDAIKLDVDGGEVDVLRGAQKTLLQHRPILFMELSPIHFEGHRHAFQDQLRAVLDLGYRIYSLEGDALPEDPRELEASIPYGALVNILGLPG